MCSKHKPFCDVCDRRFRHRGCRRGTACTYVLVVCSCDNPVKVEAMLRDHEKDCKKMQSSLVPTRIAA